MAVKRTRAEARQRVLCELRANPHGLRGSALQFILSLNPAYNSALASLEASGHAQFVPGAGWIAIDRTDAERCPECAAPKQHRADVEALCVELEDLTR
jgi:hypothetical protein